MHPIIKLVITAVLVVLISEVAKRSSLLGGLLASLPIVSYLALIWLWVDTHDAQKVSALSTSVFWLVLPSLPFFLVLPMLMKRLSFAASLGIATAIMFACYLLMMALLKRVGVAL
jgi:hypothetical protein